MRRVYRDSTYSAVDKWNAVDVAVKEDLEHGFVINATEHGVIVDFRCPGRRSEFVQYGHLFDCSKSTLLEDHRSDFVRNSQVQVLLQTDPARPWRWFNATVLDFIFNRHGQGYGIVQLPMGNKEIVPEFQIRKPPLMEDILQRIIWNNDFAVRSCCLPKDFRLPFSSEFWTLVKQRMSDECAYPVSVVGETLVYIQRQGYGPVFPHELTSWLTAAQSDIKNAAKEGKKLVGNHWTWHHPLAMTAVLPVNQTEPDELPLMAVPVDVLLEVFQSLDTVNRVNCRRVCEFWNDLLSDTAFKDVILAMERRDCSMARRNYCAFPCSCDYDPVHFIFSYIFKSITPATKRIVLLNADTYHLEDTLPVLKDVISQTEQVRGTMQLVLDESEWLVRSDNIAQGIATMAGFLAALAPMFGTLVWKKFTVKFDNEVQYCHVIIRNGILNPASSNLETDLWKMLERDLPTTDKQVISQWITGAANGQLEGCDTIITILDDFQGTDPRPTSRYRGRTWTEETLKELDVGKLSKLTLYALNHELKECRYMS